MKEPVQHRLAMRLRILTPQAMKVDTDVEMVTIPALYGQRTPLAGHDYEVVSLISGKVRFRHLPERGMALFEEWMVGEGEAEITRDAVTLFVSSAERKIQQ